MTEPKFDVLCIGNAIVDILARADDDFLVAKDLHKGTMHLIDAERAESLYDAMGPAIEASGGSAGNTAAGHRLLRRLAPPSSARSPTTSSATSTPTTCGPSASISARRGWSAARRPPAR